jgi:hypothetical protein
LIINLFFLAHSREEEVVIYKKTIPKRPYKNKPKILKPFPMKIDTQNSIVTANNQLSARKIIKIDSKNLISSIPKIIFNLAIIIRSPKRSTTRF